MFYENLFGFEIHGYVSGHVYDSRHVRCLVTIDRANGIVEGVAEIPEGILNFESPLVELSRSLSSADV